MFELSSLDYSVVTKLFVALLFSGLIGYEREMSESNAGLKTHILVGVGSAIIALIQVEIIGLVLETQAAGLDSALRSDPGRLIAQVISGIGFLGGGTIIVTKRNVTGLTTAASIWAVAGIGLAVGMGFYTVAVAGFLFVISTLFVFKRVIIIHPPERVVVKHITKFHTSRNLEKIFSDFGLEVQVERFSTDTFGNELIYTHVFKILNSKRINFAELIDHFAQEEGVVSVERSNIVS